MLFQGENGNICCLGRTPGNFFSGLSVCCFLFQAYAASPGISTGLVMCWVSGRLWAS